MSDVVIKNQPCLSKTCGSSDARQIYEKGDSFCFSCKSYFTKKEGEAVGDEFSKTSSTPKIYPKSGLSVADIKEMPIRGFRDRAINKAVASFYHVRVGYNENGNIDTHYYPYDDSSQFKVRQLPKKFSWTGKSNSLFGKERFNGGGRRLVICEGEVDTLSMAQASFDKYQKIYPAVGISSSAIAHKTLLENRDWIRSFKEVVICFDEDEAGEKAKEVAIKIIGLDKVKIMKLELNDANDTLTTSGSSTLLTAMFDAAAYVPTGIIGKEELWEALLEYNEKPSYPYPACMESINQKLKGMREGEITLFISGTGSGKSTMLREIMIHILETTEETKIGVISLEESPAETARKLSGMSMNRNPAAEEIPIEELKEGFDKVFASDRVILLDHQGALGDSNIIEQLEYMALSGCKYLFIDHITILVSEGVENLTGLEAQDKIMNDLLRLTKRHSVWIGLVSHLRKVATGRKSFEEGVLPTLDDIRGSGSIKQISFDIIAFARDMQAAYEQTRNTIKMAVLKSRFTGLTGRVNDTVYDFETGRLKSVSDEDMMKDKDEFTEIVEIGDKSE